MGKKAPAMQFYVRDWLSDPQLRLTSPSTRGIWMDILCFMWEAPERGKLEGSLERLGRMVGASNGDMELFLEEIKTCHFCDIYETSHKIVTLINRRMFREQTERNRWRIAKRAERERKRVTEMSSPHSSSSSSLVVLHTTCPQQKIVDLYHEVLPELPPIKEWNEPRQKLLRKRWKDDTKRQTLDWWKNFFEYIRGSPFLMGDKTDFQANLEWLIRPKNFAKIIEGNYHR